MLALESGHLSKQTENVPGFMANKAGGILGGISTGQPIRVSVAIKPTSSIRTERDSIDVDGQAATVQTLGRHDPCVGLRAPPIAEALMALVLMDHVLRHRAQNADVQVQPGPIPGAAGGAGAVDDIG